MTSISTRWVTRVTANYTAQSYTLPFRPRLLLSAAAPQSADVLLLLRSLFASLPLADVLPPEVNNHGWKKQPGFFLEKVFMFQGFLVRERSALADPYCQSTWMSVCLFVCPQVWGQISRKPKVLGEKLLWGAYRKVVRGFGMVTSAMTSRDPTTS